MKVELIEIGRVIPYARNPRRNENAIAKVAASIKEYGFRQPIVVDEEMVIIAGHTRLQAAQSLGLKKVPVHIADGLTLAQIRHTGWLTTARMKMRSGMTICWRLSLVS